jgi:hypothetical protein
MPNPFPGMDPFIEDQCWSDFHSRYITALGDALNAKLRPKYVARTEERVYFERHGDDKEVYVVPDVFLAGRPERTGVVAAGAAALAEPELFSLPMGNEVRETFLELRKLPGHEVVALLEVLSPSNKRPGSDGQRLYLERRLALLESRIHLIEIDLLRGGDRLPTRPPLPATDYCVMVSPGRRRPHALVYRWLLRQPLPAVSIPLAPPDPDLPLDLNAVLAGMYDRAGYDYSLDRSTAIAPPLPAAEVAWVSEQLAALP